MKPSSLLPFSLATTLLLFPAQDGFAVVVANYGFENPAIADGTFSTSDAAAPPGWSIYGPLSAARHFGVLNPNGTTLYGEAVPEGASVGVTFLADTGGAEGGLEQVLSESLQLDTVYTLTVEVGNLANDANPPHNAFDFTGFPGYRVELLAGGTVVASDNNTLAPGEGQFLTSVVPLVVGLSHANAGELLAIRLVNLNGPGIEVNFDNVRLDAVAVPEPAGIACGLAATCGLFALVRRWSRTSPRSGLPAGRAMVPGSPCRGE